MRHLLFYRRQITATPEKVGGTGNRTFVSDQSLSVQDGEGKEVEN